MLRGVTIPSHFIFSNIWSLLIANNCVCVCVFLFFLSWSNFLLIILCFNRKCRFLLKKKMNGAMTYILTETVKENPQMTYGALLDTMANHIENINNERWIKSRIIRKVLRHKTIQVWFCSHDPCQTKSLTFLPYLYVPNVSLIPSSLISFV